MKAIRIHQHGGPEVLRYEDAPSPAPKAGEVLIRNHAIGLNFIDIYYRTGAYVVPSLPFTPGNESAGEVVAVGEGVTELRPGDRVATTASLGGYAQERAVDARALVKLPDGVAYETAAAMMLKGLTAQYLLKR